MEGPELQQDHAFSGEIIDRMYWKLFPPQAVSMLASAITLFLNGIIVSRFLSPNPLIIIGITTPVLNLLNALGMLFSCAGTVSGGHALGRGDTKKLNRIFSAVVGMTLALGLVLFLFFLFFPEVLARGNLTAVDRENLLSYMHGWNLSIIPMLLNSSLLVFLQLGNQSSKGTVGTIITTVCITLGGFLNAVVFHGGFAGAGIIMFLSQLLPLLFYVFTFITCDNLPRYEFGTPDKQIITDILKFGMPTSIDNILFTVAMMVITINLQINYPAVYTASYGILNSIAQFLSMFDYANINVGSILSSMVTGEMDITSMKELYRRMIRHSFLTDLIFHGLLFIFAGPFLSLFTSEPDVIAESTIMLRLYLSCAFMYAFNQQLLNIYVALGKVRLVCIINVLCTGFYMISSGFVMPLLIGPHGIRCYNPVSQILTALTILGICIVQNRHFPRNPEELFLLDRNVKDAPSMDAVIRSPEDCAHAGERLQNFCKAQGYDSRLSFFSCLCVEELADYILLQNQEKGVDKVQIDLFVS